MAFIQIGSETVLNTDAIDCIHFNYIPPNTQNRCIRIELRAISDSAESRVVILPHSPQLESALLTTLKVTPLQPVKTSSRANPFQITLLSEEQKGIMEDFLVDQIPRVGEYVVIWTEQGTISKLFRVNKVCHEISVTDSGQSPAHSEQSAKPYTTAVLEVRPCEPPLSLYDLSSPR